MSSNNVLRVASRRLASVRCYSTKVKVQTTDSAIADANEFNQAAPNRVSPWSPSQMFRKDAIDHPKFLQKDLDLQPRPYSAMELIHKQPVRYIEHGNIAVCNGNKGRHQGHPKVFINLDQPRPNVCGYCGLKFAKAEHKHVIEASKAEGESA